MRTVYVFTFEQSALKHADYKYAHNAIVAHWKQQRIGYYTYRVYIVEKTYAHIIHNMDTPSTPSNV